MSINTIKGNVILKNVLVQSQQLMSLEIELYSIEDNNIPNGLWIGSGKLNELGAFNVKYYSDNITLSSLMYKIYNGKNLISSGVIQNIQDIEIEIDQEEYDGNVKYESRKKIHLDYTVISGRILLNNKNVLAIPKSDEVLVLIKKVLFRDSLHIAATTIDKLGRYEIKIPFKVLYPEEVVNYNKFPQINIDIEIDNEIIASSQLLSFNENYIECDFTINSPESNEYFTSEYENVAEVIKSITNLDEEDFRTIVSTGNSPEIDIVVINSGLEFETVDNIKTASIYSYDTQASMQHFYALIREGYKDIGVIFNLSLEQIEAIIEDAYNYHIIPELGDIEETFGYISNYKIKIELEQTNDDGDSLNDILKSILDEDILVEEFLKIYDKNKYSPIEHLWAEIESELGDSNMKKIKNGLQIISIVGLQKEMIQAFMNYQIPFLQFITESNLNTIQSFIQQVCITHQKLCVPKIIRGNVSIQDYNNTQIHHDYAVKLNENGKQLFSSKVISDRLSSDQEFSSKFTNPNNLIQFFSQNKEFDFRINNVWDDSLTISDELRKDLMPLQNLTRLTNGRIDLVVQLIKSNIRSSHQIAEMTLSEFQDLFNVTQINYHPSVFSSIYSKAIQIDLYVKNTYSQLFPGNYIEKVTMDYSSQIWDKDQDAQSGFPDYESLFGNMDFCSCSDCSSMYSPSAYFTDVFHFIETRLGTSDAYTELIRRRPDLPHIDISCKNANTPIPYIDLVNELLELIILHEIKNNDEEEAELFIPDSFQTSGNEEELNACPEHTYKDVEGDYREYKDYTKVYELRLNKSVYPNTLPFNLPLEESRKFLNHFGKSRFELMQLFQPEGYTLNLDADKINEYNLAAEWFSLSRIEADIITKNSNEDIPEEIWKFYGFDSEGTWYDDLCEDIQTLLNRSNIEYKEFLQLLVTDFLNPLMGDPLQRPFAIVSKPGKPVDTCNLDELMLEYRQIDDEDIDEAKILFFDKMHRFIRLVKATNWTIYQLDIVLNSFLASDIDIYEFLRVYKTSQLCKLSNSLPEYAVIFWSNISTTNYINFNRSNQEGEESLYDKFFKNKSVVNPIDENFSDPTSILGTIEENKATILAAFEISENDLLTVFENDLEVSTTLENLSKLYSYVLRIKALKRDSIYELNEQLSTMGIVAPNGTLDELINDNLYILTKINEVDKSIFTWDEYAFILRNADTENVFNRPNTLITNYYENLRLELNRTLNNFNLELDPVEHPEVEILKAKLEKIAIQQFSAQFNLNYTITEYILSRKTKIGTTPDYVLKIIITNDFINSDEAIERGNSIDILNFDDLFSLYNEFVKVQILVSKMALQPNEFIFFQEHSESIGILDINDLPETDIEVANTSLVNSLFHWMDWVQARDILALNEDNIISLVNSAINDEFSDNETWKELLSDYAGWSSSSLDFLLENGISDTLGVLNYKFDPESIEDNDYRLAKIILQLNSIFNSINKIGLIVSDVYDSLQTDINSIHSVLLRKTVKSKYEDAQWYKIIKPIQDDLRIKQRNALVAYIVVRNDIIPENNLKWNNENDLFAYLLIDVQIEACMKTSRLKQGISSLQLFLDRLLLSLEKINTSGIIISIDEEAIQQWKSWRKWYRIWEANRKIFLYPENWIEPELRDNKTPLFKELESFLLQDEPTESYVEAGFKNYLYELEDIARLEPISVYHEHSNELDVVHVIARNNQTPHSYYYRKYEDLEWSAWEKIEIDIESDHIAPVIFNNKLHIFWLSFMNRKNLYPVPPLSSTPPSKKWIDVLNNIDEGYKKYRILPTENDGRDYTCEVWLNWTYMQDGKWQKQQMSGESMKMEIGRYEINSTAQDTYGSSASAKAFDLFTKKGDIPQQDFFKNRIYLFTPDYKFSAEEGIIFNLLLPGGWDESAKGVHSFRWLGDVTRQPIVVKDTEYSWSLIAPYGTRFNNMKFEQDEFLGNKLKTDTTYDKIKSGHFTFSDNVFIHNTNTWYRKGESLSLLNDIPNSTYRLTGLAANKHFKDTDFNRTAEKFFFEDSVNTFYVEKVSMDSIPKSSLSSLLISSKISPASAITYSLASYPLVISSDVMYGEDLAMIDKVTLTKSLNPQTYLFHTFYHAQIGKFISKLERLGVQGLLTLKNQSQADTLNFNALYKPTSLVNSNYPKNNVQFGYSDPYSLYNWELFYHAPMMIAQRLNTNLQFDAAQKWYHYIFNPTSNANIDGGIIHSNQRFWKFYPFYAEAGSPAQTLAQLLTAIHENNLEAVAQVRKWEKNPFNPHVIARMRILSYMKNVLMKYLDNLIDWGDHLYRMDTIESINEATQLYILASNILGDKPIQIPPRVKRNNYTYEELSEMGLDALSNALVDIESFYAPNDFPSGTTLYSYDITSNNPGNQSSKIPLQTFYFCLPPNEKLLKYWDVIEDRLFKIRHCMSIDGTIRQLPLFEPPIDPALLVRATAIGLDVNSVLSEVYGVYAPHYRFQIFVQKCNELINDVKSLGASILSAIEKNDAETLSLIRNNQERALLEKMRDVKILQVNEAMANLEALYQSRESTLEKLKYYSTRAYMNSRERSQQEHLQNANKLQIIQGVLQAVAGVVSAIPTTHAQMAASGVSIGGLHFSNVLQAASAVIGIKTVVENFKASEAGMMGGYDRRKDEWDFQKIISEKEVVQVEKQIIAAEIRLDIAERDLQNHDLQIENNLQIDSYMRSKFSNSDLYSWMTSQLASVYFQSYQLAYETALKADFCYRYELPMRSYPTDGFIKYGYWDSLKKGLLSGEKLQLDLRRMETAYLDENARELELMKHISLAIFSPEAILSIKRTGTCTVEIPELLFDLDYPGHYMRRIKSVSLTIPCIAGPYTTINCQLTQTSSKYRKEKTIIVDYNNEANFTEVNRSMLIATSNGQNDGGMFELNFRDERYLPFEGTGAISTWNITFPDEYRQFDYDTITDIVMHINYTARFETGLVNAAKANIKSVFENLSGNDVLHRFYSIKHEFSNEWYAYLNAIDQELDEPLTILIRPEQFPFFTQDRNITINKWHMQLNPKRNGIELEIEDEETEIDLLLEDNHLASSGAVSFAVTEEGLELKLTLSFNEGYDYSDITDIYLVADYILEDE